MGALHRFIALVTLFNYCDLVGEPNQVPFINRRAMWGWWNDIMVTRVSLNGHYGLHGNHDNDNSLLHWPTTQVNVLCFPKHMSTIIFRGTWRGSWCSDKSSGCVDDLTWCLKSINITLQSKKIWQIPEDHHPLLTLVVSEQLKKWYIVIYSYSTDELKYFETPSNYWLLDKTVIEIN